jgi:hypothetical protein
MQFLKNPEESSALALCGRIRAEKPLKRDGKQV